MASITAIPSSTDGAKLRHGWLLMPVLLVFGLVYVQYISKVQHSETGVRSAFLRWRVQLRDLDEGIDVWEKYAYPNPPIMAIILKPFLWLPPLVGSSLWFGVKVILAMVAMGIVVSLLDGPDHPFPLWGKVLAVCLSLRPMEGDLVHGNVNLFVLFLVAMCLFCCWRRREYSAGLFLALGIACKLTPILFVPYLVWKRAWKTLLGTSAGLVLFVLVVPGLVFGWNNNLRYLESWNEQMVAPYAAGAVTSEHKNQSLPGLLHRMLADEPSFSDFVGEQKVVLEKHNLASLDRGIVQTITLACMAAFALVSIVYFRHPLACTGSWRLLAEFSIVILGMLLFCERTWKHHCVTLLLPLCVVAHGFSAPGFSWPTRWYLGATLSLVGAVMFSTSTGHVDAHLEAQQRWAKLAQVYGAYVWAFLLLLASLFVMLSKRPSAGDGPLRE